MIWIGARRLLFVHNPKCAGTAIHKALLSEFPDAQAAWGRRYDAARDEIEDLAHLSIAEGRAHFAIDGAFRSFGFVRDPYARFVSSYLHLKHWNRDWRDVTPDDLLFDVLDEERIRGDWKFVHFAPQYRFFYEGTMRAVTELWKAEALPGAWRQVCDAFDLRGELTTENRIGGEVALGAGAVSRLNQLYARDFALFGYERRRGAAFFRKPRALYAGFAKLWPERRDLDVSDLAKE
jgi:sulfotransferase famil protein